MLLSVVFMEVGNDFMEVGNEIIELDTSNSV
jgi:hypothetical protein